MELIRKRVKRIVFRVDLECYNYNSNIKSMTRYINKVYGNIYEIESKIESTGNHFNMLRLCYLVFDLYSKSESYKR